MSSSIKHIVEPTVGWLLMVVLIFVLGAALVARERPTVEATGPGHAETERTR